MENKKEIEELVSKIKEASEKYYDGNPIISDEEFNNLTYKLSGLDPENPILSSAGWGLDVENLSGTKAKLDVPMTGISDKRRVDDDYKLSNEDVMSYSHTPKLDGLAMQLVYSNGVFVRALTRSTGTIGIIKTDHVKYLVPNRIPMSGELIISGEIVMDEESFRNNYDTKKQHPRNCAAGIIGRTLADKDLLSRLSFIAYRVLRNSTNKDSVNSYMRAMQELKHLGFNTVSVSKFTGLPVKDLIIRGFLSDNKYYRTDGIVLTKDMLVSDKDGYISYEGTYCMKIDDEYAESTVVGIEWNMGSTGRYVPTVLLTPVELSGCVVKRATGNNYSWIMSRKIGVGSVVKIIRSGEIIPKIVEVVTESINMIEPTVCEYCGRDLVWEGADIRCTNPNCDGLFNNRLHRYFNCMGYGVDNIGPSAISDIISENSIQSILDIYKVNYKEVYSRGTITDSLKIKLFEALKVPRTIDYFLVGMSIPGLSWKGASKYFDTPIIKLLQGEFVEIDRPKGVNSKAHNFIYDHLEELREVASMCKFIEPEKSDTEYTKKIKVCVTGSLNKFSSRKELFSKYDDLLEDASIKNCEYLVTNNSEGNSSKLKYARANDVKIITEEDLCNLLVSKLLDSSSLGED